MNKTLAWLTDPHLDFLDERQLMTFIESVAKEATNGMVMTGDIAEARSLLPILARFDEAMAAPLWFVLGNHDYYGGSIHAQREQVAAWSGGSRHVRWLPQSGVVSLSETTALVGHGGWGDGGYGDFMASGIMLNDYRHIEDLVCSSKGELFRRLRELGIEAADIIEGFLDSAFKDHEHVILATHVPPFVESCWHEGQATLNEWTPHFSCRAVGDRLLAIMDRHRTKSLHVICGHTHSGGVANPRDNLCVVTGGADYGNPALQSPITYT
jgi:3',5'-cyclic AMP phosphodiesterase CpdA